MYSRSLDPGRISSPLPRHYGGSAFRSDGTPTPIPVRREPDLHRDEGRTAEPMPAAENADAVTEPEDADRSTVAAASGSSEQSVLKEGAKERGAPFLSRLFGGVLPGLREDDLLLVLLILLLSSKEGNEDALLLLAVLLFGD